MALSSFSSRDSSSSSVATYSFAFLPMMICGIKSISTFGMLYVYRFYFVLSILFYNCL
eukprot:SAG31_NODE_1257_length_9081_cov_7.585838_2_plen_58_part_00